MVYLCGKVNSTGETCKLSLKKNSELQRHILSWHTQVKCKWCKGSSFTDKFALEIHKKTHSKTLYCPKPWCAKQFTALTRDDDLAAHLQVCKTTDSAIICIKCNNKQCTSIEVYRLHLKNKNAHGLSQAEASAIIAEGKAAHLKSAINSDCETDFETTEDDVHPTPPEVKKAKLTVEDSQSLYKLSEPTKTTDRQLLRYGQLTVLYSYETKGPRVSHMHLTQKNLIPQVKRCSQAITKLEPRIEDPAYRALPSDFTRRVSGGKDFEIEKGHMLPSSFLRIDAETAASRPFLSTVVPQNKMNNQSTWSTCEEHVVWLLRHTYAAIDSFAGPLYVSDKGNVGALPIPSHFFMLLVCHLPGGKMDLEILVVPNEEMDPGIGLSTFYKTYSELIAMDKNEFIPRFELVNFKHVNGVITPEN